MAISKKKLAEMIVDIDDALISQPTPPTNKQMANAYRHICATEGINPDVLETMHENNHEKFSKTVESSLTKLCSALFGSSR